MKHNSQHQSPPDLIGRSPQLGQLTVALERVEANSGHAVFLTGPAGIGKSFLAEQLMTLAKERGYVVLSGRAYPLEEHLDFAPVIRALSELQRLESSGQQSDLAGELPALTHLVHDLSFVANGEKTELFHTVLEFVRRVAERRPVLWFVDDLHWADPATIELLRHLAVGTRNQRVLLVAAFQNAASDTFRYMSLPLHALARIGLSEEIALDRLEPEAVALLAKRTLGARPSRTLLDYLESRAKGNPLLIQSLLNSLSAQGALLRSGGVVSLAPSARQQPAMEGREMILQRVTHLEFAERQVLDLMAVMGGTARQRELLEVVGGDPSALQPMIAHLQSADLVTSRPLGEDSETWLSLTHPLFQEVLYAELPAAARQRYHAQVAAAMERLSPVPLGRPLPPCEDAGGGSDPDRTLQFLLQAAGRMADLPGQSAPHYYRAALELVRGGLHSELLPSVLLGLGQSLAKAGELMAARECLSEAVQMLEQSGDTQGAGRMHQHAAYIEAVLGNLDAASAHVEMGIHQLSGCAWDWDLVRLHGLRSMLAVFKGDFGDISEHVATLTEAADALNTPDARAWLCHARTWEALVSGQANAAVAAAAEGLDQAWHSQDPLLITTLTGERAATVLLRGDHRTAAAELRSTLTWLPRAYAVPAAQVLSPFLTMAEAMAGNWEAALIINDESVPLEPLLQTVPTANLGARAILLIRQGHLDEARTCLESGSRNRPPYVTDFDYAEACLALESGQYQEAVEKAMRLHTWVLVPLGLALQAEAQVALGETEVARQLGAVLTAGGAMDLPLCTALGSWLEGLAAAAGGEAAAACEAFTVATQQFDALAMPCEAARARFEHAKQLAGTDRKSALALARQSLQAFAELGAELWARRVSEWLGDNAPRTRAAKGAGTPEPPGEAHFSKREWEILRLLDEGLSDAEIAERLVISRRTVGNHLERMYSRHGVKSRLALVRFARANGII